MDFIPYQHVERFGNEEVAGIELGTCTVFHKLDGTNASVWLDLGVDVCKIRAGSRRRELSLESDNAGFFAWASQNERIMDFLTHYPNYRLYGEWLVPHSLKTYAEYAWRRFYVFDVVEHLEGDAFRYIPYNEYKDKLEAYCIDYIPAICTIKNGSYEQFIKQLDHSMFMVKDGEGRGEGIVIKRYDFVNQYGRQAWAKIVTNEFKEKHAKVMGGHEVIGSKMVEDEIATDYVTSALVEKEYQKILNDPNNPGWSGPKIPRLLHTVYYSVVHEEAWEFVKKYKNPTINFNTLKAMVFSRVKTLKPELF